jgi:hypothetical protein
VALDVQARRFIDLFVERMAALAGRS